MQTYIVNTRSHTRNHERVPKAYKAIERTQRMTRIRRWLEVSMPADSGDYAVFDSLCLRSNYIIMTSVPSLQEIAADRDKWEGANVTWVMTAGTLNRAYKKLLSHKSREAQRWISILLEEKLYGTVYDAYATYSGWMTSGECMFRWEPSPCTKRKTL